ncbi:MAG: UvrD-helicase domain-containing protein [Candidatus Doudnabacteria bacterium]|nr:UvrD-helicase domain-containing protein [Candidatus Doudnabacteria bacterium]
MIKENFGLNDAQLQAVKAPMGPVLILAGAGSGKTRALTMRIVYLIKKLGLNPKNILAVTFTNKAAGEMKERILKMLGKTEMPMMGTFHSIGVRLLRIEYKYVGLDPNFVIYDSDDAESLLKDILLRLRIDPTKYKPSLFAHIIDRAKNNMEGPSDLPDLTSFDKTAKKVFETYQEDLRKNNAVDFGDLLVLPVQIFEENPEVLKKYQNQWKYILVDEYQDTNQVQYRFTKLLASAHKNIFVVGDDAQAIYGFRGANLQNILDFESDYPSAQVIRLEQNYRSTAPILSIAQKVIELSPRQHRKTLWTENEEGKTPVFFSAQDEMAEAYFVASKIIEIQDGSTKSKELQYESEEDDTILGRIMRHARSKILPKLKNREGLNNIAVLYRTHAQSRVIEEVMIDASIPYQIIGGLKFYERKEIKDILSYLRLLINPNDLVSLKRVINVPPRGIGAKSFDLLKDALIEKDEKELAGLMHAKPAISHFFEMLNHINNLDASANLLDILTQILKQSGYESFLRDGSAEGEGRWENIQELFNVGASFSKLAWKEGLTSFLEEVALMTSVDELDLNSPKVTLMTLHQAKGLEFDIVFLVGLEEGILPHARSLMDPKDIAEEVRLTYVGVTRAKKQLFMLCAQTRKQFGSRNISIPSRFLKAIPKELLDIHEDY